MPLDGERRLTGDLSPWLADQYADSLFEVWLPEGAVVFSVGGSPTGHIAALPEGGPLAVVTAYNPGAHRPSPAENERANRKLEQVLQERGWRYYPAAGYDRARTHEEPSFAVMGITEAEAAELGRAFGQACVFYWDGEAGKLVWCS